MEERINLELSRFDTELILKTLNDAYKKALQDVWVESHWVKNDDGFSVMDYGHWEHRETKESKRLKSTINFIEKQLK